MNTKFRQSGAVLITSLIFLVVLTLVAVVAMQSTSLEQKMSTNTAYKLQTFEDAEAARSAINAVMYPHFFGKDSWDDFNIPDGFCITDTSITYNPSDPTANQDCTIDGTETTLAKFFDNDVSDGYETVASNWDKDKRHATYTADGVDASIFVYRTHMQPLGGVSRVGQKSYNRGGGGSGASEAYYFDVRVRATNPATGTTSTVAVDYRYIQGATPKDGIQ